MMFSFVVSSLLFTSFTKCHTIPCPPLPCPALPCLDQEDLTLILTPQIYLVVPVLVLAADDDPTSLPDVPSPRLVSTALLLVVPNEGPTATGEVA